MQRAAQQSSGNAFKQYLRSRPAASMASVKRLKEEGSRALGVHPLLRTAGVTAADDTRAQLLDAVRSYKASRVSGGHRWAGRAREGVEEFWRERGLTIGV